MRLIDADELLKHKTDHEMISTHVIYNAPTAQKWIPCNEKLPNEEGEYLVSGGGSVWVCEFLIIGRTRGWRNSCHNPTVRAWMPLPEPYKEVKR